MSTSTPLSWLLLQALQADLQQINGAPNWRSSIGTLVSLECEQAEVADLPMASLRVTGWSDGNIGTIGAPARAIDVALEIAVDATVVNAQQEILKAAEDVHELYRLTKTITLSANAQALVTATAATVLDQPDGMPAVICSIRLDCQCIEFT